MQKSKKLTVFTPPLIKFGGIKEQIFYDPVGYSYKQG